MRVGDPLDAGGVPPTALVDRCELGTSAAFRRRYPDPLRQRRRLLDRPGRPVVRGGIPERTRRTGGRRGRHHRTVLGSRPRLPWPSRVTIGRHTPSDLAGATRMVVFTMASPRPQCRGWASDFQTIAEVRCRNSARAIPWASAALTCRAGRRSARTGRRQFGTCDSDGLPQSCPGRGTTANQENGQNQPYGQRGTREGTTWQNRLGAQIERALETNQKSNARRHSSRCAGCVKLRGVVRQGC